MQGKSVVLQLSNEISINESNYAKVAERIIKVLKDRGKSPFNGLSTTKLRSIYGLITNIYTRINTPEDFNENISDLQYIKVKLAYEWGRDKESGEPIKNFIKGSFLMSAIDNIETYDQFILYCRYAESLVAYFKFYGGKE